MSNPYKYVNMDTNSDYIQAGYKDSSRVTKVPDHLIGEPKASLVDALLVAYPVNLETLNRIAPAISNWTLHHIFGSMDGNNKLVLANPLSAQKLLYSDSTIHFKGLPFNRMFKSGDLKRSYKNKIVRSSYSYLPNTIWTKKNYNAAIIISNNVVGTVRKYLETYSALVRDGVTLFDLVDKTKAHIIMESALPNLDALGLVLKKKRTKKQTGESTNES